MQQAQEAYKFQNVLVLTQNNSLSKAQTKCLTKEDSPKHSQELYYQIVFGFPPSRKPNFNTPADCFKYETFFLSKPQCHAINDQWLWMLDCSQCCLFFFLLKGSLGEERLPSSAPRHATRVSEHLQQFLQIAHKEELLAAGFEPKTYK